VKTRQGVTRLTIPEALKVTDYLRELGQEGINKRNLTMPELAKEAAAAVGFEVSYRNIGKLLRILGFKTNLAEKQANPVAKELSKGELTKRVKWLEEKVRELVVELGDRVTELKMRDEVGLKSIGEGLDKVKYRVDSLEKELGVDRSSTTVPPPANERGIATPYLSCNGNGKGRVIPEPRLSNGVG
jgi:hypothetical protein